MALDVLVQVFVWFDLVKELFVMVVNWSQVSLYSWIEFGGTVVAMLVCKTGFCCNGFRLATVWKILFCVIGFAGWKELTDQL